MAPPVWVVPVTSWVGPRPGPEPSQGPPALPEPMGVPGGSQPLPLGVGAGCGDVMGRARPGQSRQPITARGWGWGAGPVGWMAGFGRGRHLWCWWAVTGGGLERGRHLRPAGCGGWPPGWPGLGRGRHLRPAGLQAGWLLAGWAGQGAPPNHKQTFLSLNLKTLDLNLKTLDLNLKTLTNVLRHLRIFLRHLS